MAVVAVSGSEMTPCDKAAGAYAEFEVEWMADQAVFFRKSGQSASARCGSSAFPFA
jgi:hypothetical protein